MRIHVLLVLNTMLPCQYKGVIHVPRVLMLRSLHRFCEFCIVPKIVQHFTLDNNNFFIIDYNHFLLFTFDLEMVLYFVLPILIG